MFLLHLLQILPFAGGPEAKPSNKSVIEAAPAFEDAREESETDERSSSDEIGSLLLVLGDNISIVDELLCAGSDSVGAEGDPIDKRSKRTSVLFFEVRIAPKYHTL
jgi:hypothetical protein